VYVLSELGKWSAIAELLAPGSPLAALWVLQDERAAVRADALLKAGQTALAWTEYAALLRTPTALMNWDHFVGCIAATERKEDTLALFAELQAQAGENRGPFLAVVELEKRMTKREGQEAGALLAALAKFVSKFSTGPMCGLDVRPYLEELVLRRKVPAEDICKVMEAALEPIAGANADEGLRKRTALLEIRRMLGMHSRLDVAATQALVGEMASACAEAVARDPPKNGAPTSADEMLQLCYATLMDLHAKTESIGVLYDAAALLESVLHASENNCQARVCLIEVYKLLAALKPGQVHFWNKSLGVRNVLLESCGHLFIEEGVLHLDLAGVATSLMDAVHALHAENDTQVPENIIQAYRSGKYTKVVEFACFHKRMASSALLQYVRTELTLVNLANMSTVEAVQMLSKIPLDVVWVEGIEATEFLGDQNLFLFNKWDPIVESPAPTRIPLFLHPEWLLLRRISLRVLIVASKPNDPTALPSEVSALLAAVQKAGIVLCTKDARIDITRDSLTHAAWSLFVAIVQMVTAGAALISKQAETTITVAEFKEKFDRVESLVAVLGKALHMVTIPRQQLCGFLHGVGACIAQGILWGDAAISPLLCECDALLKKKKKSKHKAPALAATGDSSVASVRDHCRSVNALLGSLARSMCYSLGALATMQPHDGIPETLFSQQPDIVARRDAIVRDVAASQQATMARFIQVLQSH
jgi:hypothetical protein